MRVALVAGEASGDILGSTLMRALRARHPEIRFEGIGGPLMEAEGMASLYPMERLSVMGLVEVLGRLPELLRIRRRIARRWCEDPPDLFVGIDAPDFNLGLEARLRAEGITTAHYVSPSVWAWREGRVKKIARAADLVLCLFPFEPPFYACHGVAAEFVGHPLADELAEVPGRAEARSALGLATGPRYVALLPGSRSGEVARLGPLFLDAAERMLARRPELHFLLPAASRARRQQLEDLLAGRELPVTLTDGRSREAMLAAEAVLLASGTAALEAMLLRRPMVVAYRFAPLSWAIIRRLVRVKYASLPNLLADAPLVPELLQDAATPEALCEALLTQLEPQQQAGLLARFETLHQQLRQDASARAAEALLALAAKGGQE